MLIDFESGKIKRVWNGFLSQLVCSWSLTISREEMKCNPFGKIDKTASTKYRPVWGGFMTSIILKILREANCRP